MRRHDSILPDIAITIAWLIISIGLMWFIFAGIDRHVQMAEAQGVERMRAAVVKQRMKFHGTNAAHLAENGIWYFRDKEGRLCRL